MEYKKEEVERLIIFTKHLEYMDGTKPQCDFTAQDILNKWTAKEAQKLADDLKYKGIRF